MDDITNFIDEFADYLGNPRRLPFVARPYDVVKPEKGFFATREPFTDPYPPIRFHLARNGKNFGHLEVCQRRYVGAVSEPIFEYRTIWINGINSGYHKVMHPEAKEGLGREFVRRVALYAVEHRYDKIKTSLFTHEASSFWFGLGFRSEYPVVAAWNQAGDLSQETPHWKEKLAASPDAIWDMAQTQFGQRVLFNKGGPGILDLCDEVRRGYAFERLHLTDHFRKTP